MFTKSQKRTNRQISSKQISTTGFTLIEMLVAITVLLLSIGGPLTIAAQAIFSSNIARDRLTAAYLAQEGIELVRYNRDRNAIQSHDWLNNLDVCLAPGACEINPGSTANNPMACDAGGCQPLDFYVNESLYVYANYPNSIFTRTIKIEEIVIDQEARVTSEVGWQAGGKTHNVILEENIFNWR